MKFDSTIEIGNRKIGDNYPTFITFEAGPTHNGLKSAKELAKIASESGADAIKFQILDSERLMADKEQLFEYNYIVNKKTNSIAQKKESLFEILKRREMTKDEWSDLKKYCDKIKLPFFATVAFEDEIDFIKEIGCESVKIASADVNFYELIKKASETGLAIQLDTGNSTIGEVEKAVRVVNDAGNKKIIVHHCPTGYPAKLDSVNLNIIKSLKSLFNFPIAFSDHSPGYDMDIAAVSMGANLLEKTITLDKSQESVEHIMSLEPDESYQFVKKIRDLEKAFGSNVKILKNEDIEKRKLIRRSPYVLSDFEKGTNLKELKVIFSRPGLGVSPEEFNKFLSEGKLARCLKKGDIIKHKDIVFSS